MYSLCKSASPSPPSVKAKECEFSSDYFHFPIAIGDQASIPYSVFLWFSPSYAMHPESKATERLGF